MRPFFVPEARERLELSEKTLNALLGPLVEDLGYEFVGLEFQRQKDGSLVRVYIDTESGVDLDDCERVSRAAAALLDVEDPLKGHYTLEISSPGLDRPLFTPEQYQRFVGEQVTVTTFAPVEGRRRFKGPLRAAGPEQVEIEQDGVLVTLEMGNIAKARLVPDYDRIMAGRGAGDRKA